MKTFSEHIKIGMIDTTREFIIIKNESGYAWDIGDILEFVKADGINEDKIPLMRRKSDGSTGFIHLYKLYYNEGQKPNGDYKKYISDEDDQ